ncbi:hypothetical protein MXB_4598 [Myxobolus squamalis]|nr:hypothetical protein MXB_4598 [Myxobolus squamalis]
MLIIALLLIFTFKTYIHLRVEQPCLTREWEEHKYKYNLEYSVEEDIHRKKIFMKNYQFIMKSNSKNLNFTLKINKFSHLV